MQKNIYEIVEELLLKDDGGGDYLSEDNKLLKAKLYSDIMMMDKRLLNLLLTNEKVKETFFENIEGILVFDKQKFAWFIESKEFLPDSYTKYTNKIGLTSNGEYIIKKNEVVLDFPYKDCILEGGQDKDDQKRKEIFYNEIIASEEIRRMLSPKVFTRAKRYSKDRVEENIIFNEKDNLIIKGNNLIALSSILKRYEGKVKCIYIDPPYNTGNDSFNYNDKFNHSTWLTFMKNRLELAKKLLREDGVIFVHCDDNEQAYLKVLMDDIFGGSNFIETITVVNNPRGRDYGGIANMHEFIHVYVKNKQKYKLNKLEDTDKVFPYEDDISGYEVRELRNRNTTFNDINRPNLCYPFYVNPDNEVDNGFLEVSLEPRDNFVEVMPAKSMGIQTVWRWGKEKAFNNLNINVVGKKMSEEGRYMIVEKYRDNTQMARSVWWDKEVNSERGTVHLRTLFGEKVFSFPKPEELLKRIISIGTIENDIVLDFHLGSGTTCAVAHKMGRKYIGVEQMNYIQDITVERMKKVIDGEQGGISKSVNWQGGGSFVYCELLEDGNKFIDKIEEATEETIIELKEEIYKDDRIIPYITREELRKAEEEFKELTLKEKKKVLLKLIDKNKLYVNYSDMKDETFIIDNRDKEFTSSFYEGV
ncbi:DNA methyltransferase [Streptobacillus moniliformis]|uniref:DNA methyltransferase n=1 Tax=Streptobacillus moniliformis TaxID=34105 RepID=UPI0007E3CE91|nr:site-specific DNA-methyltransferase [Streptobacillus moniliformis]